MTFLGFIDPPSSFAPLDEWRAYLADIEGALDQHPELAPFIQEAKDEIARLSDDEGRSTTNRIKLVGEVGLEPTKA